MDLFKDFDFGLLDDPDFKEDSVREELISPLLKALHYDIKGHARIIRSKTLAHPYVNIGSQKRKINIAPDYLLEVNGKYMWVLDAKAPNENILDGENIEQVYSYAIHPDIRVKYFALCNGREFILRKTNDDKIIVHFHLSEIEKYWEEINKLLSPDAFIQQKILESAEESEDISRFDYDTVNIPKPIVVRKQAMKRHFGVHGYFTKQSWDVVQHYIINFSQPGDLILDPFGGSGVTLIEALMLGRKAIHIDLNPLANFLVSALIAPIDINEFTDEYEKITRKFKKNCPKTDEQIKSALEKYDYPKGIKLSKDADVTNIEELFTDQQLAQLAYLKFLILKVQNENIRNSLLLSFSSSVNKFNRTFHYTQSKGGGGGDSGPFRYYRYRLAPDPPKLSLLKIFESKIKKLVSAKIELKSFINKDTICGATIYKGDATNLVGIENESIDYIYTDPPYGSKIAYLDLSVMWNAWLGFDITEEDYQKEAIEGGSRNKSSDEYCDLLSKSINEMFRVLKFNRWMSFVFAHKDPKYWHLIVQSAEKAGFEYAGAVKQTNGQSSFKKRQNPFSVLSGQLIINFKKVRSPEAIQKVQLGAEIYEIIIETIESVIAENDGASLEQINDELILKGLELGFLDILSKEYKDLTPILFDHFDFDDETETFHIKPDKKFRTNIPLDLRIRYFLLSYLKRNEKEGKTPTTDEIILDIMPLLKNGITPENQTILNVLSKIASHAGDNLWELKKDGQMLLNF
ncbi:MAG: DNA methyltransferase [Candidatus Cloacimonadales bacterium]|nr:DNA methyltransferase [Candidatus Cloacimonadales bacterium]